MNDDVSIAGMSVDVHSGKASIAAFGCYFKNEQEFKTAWMNYIHKQNFCEVFEIENEEKECNAFHGLDFCY